jgi:2-polyprenyl-6-methoxyphenol hydroxylase-like FAD-dependent oxidoreductase
MTPVPAPQVLTTDVVIVGGGPAGLMLAIELGCRGVACVVLEEDLASPDFPKANATSSRTMEHYRRRGFASQIRELGMGPDHPQDVVYCTRLAGQELSRFRIPSRQQVKSRTAFGDYGEEAWPTPELPHRGQQMFIEPVLKAQALRYGSVSVMEGWRAEMVTQDPDSVCVSAIHARHGGALQIKARYAAGCDGPRSLVRKTCGIAYSGMGEEAREFFGGKMLSVYFSSSDLYPALGKDRAWQYWAVNPQQRGLLLSIDGVDKFLIAFQMPVGTSMDSFDVAAASRACVGAPFSMDIIAKGEWHAGFTLVADRFASGRCFIAGDAAHLFTPTAGMGYNTSIDDVVNLGWKLAAVVQGWAPEALLDSYEAERRPIAQRNTRYARSMADSIGRMVVGPHLEEDTAQGAQERDALSQQLARHVRAEFNIPGLQLGLRYADSAIVAQEDGPVTEDLPNTYVPSAVPGARAPHAWVDGASLFDLFGPDFTLLSLAPSAPQFAIGTLEAWRDQAARQGLPLKILCLDDAAVRQLYDAPLVLVRPDHHVAWRGALDASPEDVFAVATGANESSMASP